MKVKSEWFSEWFNTSYYHLLYSNRNYEEAASFIQNLIRHLDLKKASKVIDIACGKGRHSLYFNQQGFDVTGVDLSQESIDFARSEENENLRFYVQDMRSVFKENYFDLAVNLFSSFGYFDSEEDNQRAISAMSANLKKGGVLVLDFLNPIKVISNLVSEEIKKVEAVDFHIRRYVNDADFIVKDISFTDKGKKYSFQEKIKAITEAEFRKYFEKAGLEIQAVLGSYDLKSYDTQESDRMIFIAKKI